MTLQNLFQYASKDFSGRSKAAMAGALAVMIGFGSLSVGGAITDGMTYGQPAIEQVGQTTIPAFAINHVPGIRGLVDLGVKSHETGQHKTGLSAVATGLAVAGTALATAGFTAGGLSISAPEGRRGRLDQAVRDYRAYRFHLARQRRDAAHKMPTVT